MDRTHLSFEEITYRRIYEWFCRGTALCFCFAHASLYVQYDGLYGYDGLQPVSSYLKTSKKPPGITNLLSYHEIVRLDVDTFAQILCLTGFISALATCFVKLSPISLGLSWFLYISLFEVGQTFLSFQWDILLMETGFLASLWLFAGLENKVILWAVRFCLFKLMLMSGIVKIQANCPTWLQLTALEYHYATQCIPTPLAWYAHQLPPLIHQLSVAACLVIEILIPPLILSPIRCLRNLAGVTQVLLQVLILLTGNYNFFNLLTILLSLTCFDDQFFEGKFHLVTNLRESETLNNLSNPSIFEDIGAFRWFDLMLHYLQNSSMKVLLLDTFASLVILYGCSLIFAAKYEPNVPQVYDRYRLEYTLGVANTSRLVDEMLPLMLIWFFIGIFLLVLSHLCDILASVIAKPRLSAGIFLLKYTLVTSLVVMYFSASTITFISISDGVTARIPNFCFEIYSVTRPIHITSSYGLFRRMTGVGADGFDPYNRKISNVARPEIVLEGSYDGKSWYEIEFKYKPGKPDRIPPLIAPHQPRLDWQMWFAALGSYHNAPWFIHLIQKLLHGSRDVISLLDVEAYPFHDRPPQFIRSYLYHYDFTRIPAPWNHRKGGALYNRTNWWQRSPSKTEYTPPIEIDNESALRFLESNGWKHMNSSTFRRLRECRHLGDYIYALNISNNDVCRFIRYLRRLQLCFLSFLSIIAGLTAVKLTATFVQII